MTMTLTYLDDLARVRIEATDLTGSTATVERSTDEVRWRIVRGGAEVPIVSGGFHLDDYEFPVGVEVFYRVTVPTETIEYVNVGAGAAAAEAAGGPLSPALPAGWAEGDLLLVMAGGRDTSGGPNTPAGYTLIMDRTRFRLFGKIATSSESAPSVSFAGSTGSSTCLAQVAAFRGASLTGFVADSANVTSTTAIAYPGIDPPVDLCLVLYMAFVADDFTTVSVVPGATEIDAFTSTLGSDSGMVWDYAVQDEVQAVNAGSFAVTGVVITGPHSGAIAAIRPISALPETDSITVELEQPWLKSVTRPFLNRPFVLQEYGTVERAARAGVFAVAGRTYPVAVTDVRLGRTQTIVAFTSDAATRDDLNLALASGDPVFLHMPSTAPVDSMHVVIGDTSEGRADERVTDRRLIEIPLTEVAAPHHSIAGSTNTWTGVINSYATWADVVVGAATWQALVEQIADSSDVIVE